MKMRKLVAMLMVVMMLCSIVPFSAAAEGTSATITFDDVSKRTAFDTNHQVWEENGITVTNNKGSSTSNVADYAKPARFYKNSDLIVEYPGMTKIDFNCNTASYATALAGAIDGAAVNDKVVSVALNGVDSFTCTMSGGQVRVDSITVYTGEAGDAPVEPPVTPDEPSTDPEADTELSIADAIALGASKEHNAYTEGKYYVTGVITEVYNTQYGNMYITDDAGNTLLIYGTYSADGSARYDAMDVKPVAGDTVTIYGIIGQYNGNPQIKNGWITAHTAGEAPVVPDEPDEPSTDLVLIDTPVAGVAYKFGMIQGNVSATDVYYLIGGMNGYYMATGTDAAAAIDVYLEETDGGYYMYTMVDGAKTYINMVVSGTHVNGAYEAAASTVYTFNAESKTVIAIVNDTEYWFGTRNDKTYTTVGPCAVSYAGFYCQFYAVSGGDTPVDPPVEPPVTPDEPIEGVVSNPVAGVAYKFGMIQGNVSATDVYYLIGGMNGYYMATGTDAAAAIDVYLEATEGGYYLYTADEKGTKTYINMVVSGTHVNGAYEASPSTVYTYDADAKTVIATVNDAPYWFGTRNDKTYTTVGPCATSYEGFYCQFYAAGEVAECEHAYDNACDADCNLCGEIREVSDHVYDDEYDADCNVCGAIREVPEKPVDPDVPAVGGGSADFNTIQLPASKPNGDSSYTATYTTANGWVTEYSAIQCGGSTVLNPQFPVIGADNTSKAVCLNGKVSAPGKITSPTLTGGISKLTINYTKMFTDTKLSATVTITDLTTGAVYTHTIAKEADKNTKYEIWTDEWVLETPITGDFTIVMVNDCPSAATSNKDRMTILDLSWEGAASSEEPEVPACNHEYDNACDVDCNLCGETREVSHTVKHVEAKVAVCGVNGNIEYWYCEICGAAWLDEACTLNTNLKAVILPALEHVYDYACDADCNLCGEVRELIAGGSSTVSYDMTQLAIDGQLGGGACERDLDSSVNIAISSGWFTSQTRIYKNANAVITTTTPISSLTINTSNSKSGSSGTFTVNTSTDGVTWTLHSTPYYETDYTDVTITFETPVQYVQFVAANFQIRIKTMTIDFVGGGSVHNLQHVEAVAPTCYENGNIEYWYCADCGYAWLDEACTLNTNLKAVILPMGHGTIEHVEAKDATCAELGNIEYWYCKDCGQAWLDEACTLNTNLKAVVLPTIDHTYDNAYDANCNVCGGVREVPQLPYISSGSSVSEDVSGLASKFDLTVEGIAIKDNTYNQADFTNATFGGHKLLGLGVIASNGTSSVDIKGVHMCALDGNSASFAFRVVNIPADKLDVEITMTPYFIVEIDGVVTTVYGEPQVGSYNSVSL